MPGIIKLRNRCGFLFYFIFLTCADCRNNWPKFLSISISSKLDQWVFRIIIQCDGLFDAHFEVVSANFAPIIGEDYNLLFVCFKRRVMRIKRFGLRSKIIGVTKLDKIRNEIIRREPRINRAIY